MKTTFLKYIGLSLGIASVIMATAISTAAAQTTVGVNASVGTSAKMPLSASGRINTNASASTSVRNRIHTDAMGTTGTTSQDRQQTLENRQTQAVGKIENRAGEEINSRITSLNALLTRLGSMKNLSADEKTAITLQVNKLSSDLKALQVQIQADASSTVLGTRGALSATSTIRINAQSITKDYRVYALVIPQAEILAAADRVKTITTSLTILSTKLQIRITSAQTAGNNAAAVTSVQASLSDLNSKVADAQVQATAAITGVSGLTADAGATTTLMANTAALKTARAAIAAAQADIDAASKDAHAIVSALEVKQ